jgi:glycosyltransferase involved in cell wall biosynthesis
MRVALLNTFTPYVRGGAEILVDDLVAQLREHGHETLLFRLPFPASLEAPLIATIEAARMMCFDEFDRVIAFKFPAYCLRHRAKVVWLLHQFRQVYELFGGEYGLQRTPLGESIRRMVVAADNKDLPRTRHVYTNAREVSQRLKCFNNIDSTVLMPPLKNHDRYFSRKTGNYIFYPSRITALKRQHLVIEAMRYVKSGVRLIVAGVCSEDGYLAKLRKTIRDHQLGNRVELRNEWISDEEKRQLLADALAAIYTPFQEDSCGFVSMEAHYSAKPLIACTDSGGTRELLHDAVNGFEVAPTPQAIAQAMDNLYDDKAMAERMGIAGREAILRLDITWPSTVRRLLL